jgi:hypothetical protein
MRRGGGVRMDELFDEVERALGELRAEPPGGATLASIVEAAAACARAAEMLRQARAALRSSKRRTRSEN